MEGEGEARKIVGYAAVFNSLSEDLGGFREMIMPGAFARAIEEDDVRALINHDSNLVLGRNIAGTLRLFEDEIGLRYEIDPPDTQAARDLIISLDRGDIDQSSFGFQAMEESWRNPDEDNPLPIRILHENRLFDVSPVTYPAYHATSVAARALDKAKTITSAHGRATGADADSNAVGRRDLKRRKLDIAQRRYQ
jgi:hypothetical protein